MIDNREAVEIADEFLYLTGKYFWTEDFEGFRKLFALPYYLETAEFTRVVTTESELRKTFDNLRTHYDESNIHDSARTVISAEFLDEETIGSTHVARHLDKDGQPLNQPYPCYSVMKKTGDTWKIVSSIYAILDDPELSSTLASQSESFPASRY